MSKTRITKQRVTPFLEVQKNKETGYHSIFATQNVKANIVVSTFDSEEIFSTPTRFTVQIGKNQHIGLKPNYLQYLNHHCNPNIFFDIKTMSLITLREIKLGEEITFFYPSTEWKMTEAFDCSCGAENCLKHIKGAAYLTADVYKRYKLSDYVMYEYSNKLK